MISPSTNNFQAFTSTLCQLEYSPNRQAIPLFQQNNFANNNYQLSSAFNPFQQNIAQQYSLNNNEANNVVSLFIDMLTDSLNAVMGNLYESAEQATNTEQDSNSNSNSNSNTILSQAKNDDATNTRIVTDTVKKIEPANTSQEKSEIKMATSCSFSG